MVVSNLHSSANKPLVILAILAGLFFVSSLVYTGVNGRYLKTSAPCLAEETPTETPTDASTETPPPVEETPPT